MGRSADQKATKNDHFERKVKINIFQNSLQTVIRVEIKERRHNDANHRRQNKQSEERTALFLLSECICLVMYLLIFSGFPVFVDCLSVNSGNQTGAGFAEMPAKADFNLQGAIFRK